MRKRYVYDPETGEMVEYAPPEQYDSHFIISDEMEPTVHHGLPVGSQRVFTSKSGFRRVTRSLGMTEYGNEKPTGEMPMTRGLNIPDIYEQAVAEVKNRR